MVKGWYSKTDLPVFSGRLYLRQMDQFDSTPIVGTEEANEAFFSPDGEWLAFFADRQLKKVSLMGGPPNTLCDVSEMTASGSWGPEDKIVFTADRHLYQVSSNGGEPEELIGGGEGVSAYRYPEILPDGKAVLYSVLLGSGDFQIEVFSFETGQSKVVIESGKAGQYATTGHLVYGQPTGGTLMAVPFDLEMLETTGRPVPVLEGVRQSSAGALDYSLSSDGTLAYLTGEHELSLPGTLVWVDRDGGEVQLSVEEPLENPRYPRLSPDGRKLALTTGTGDAGDIWVYDLAGQPPYPLVFEGANGHPVWTPDGKRVAFNSSDINLINSMNLYWIPADGSTLEPELLLQDDTSSVTPEDWTPDGKELLFGQMDTTSPQRRSGANDIMALSLDTKSKPKLVVQTEYSVPRSRTGGLASLSPDGRWLAYVSSVTGEPEIWVRPYPGPGAPVRISPRGGLEPIWSHDGQELFYLEGDKMMAVKIETQPEFRSQPPEVLFEESYSHQNRGSYDVAADGRFLMIRGFDSDSDLNQINVITNWFEELKRLVPTDN